MTSEEFELGLRLVLGAADDANDADATQTLEFDAAVARVIERLKSEGRTESATLEQGAGPSAGFEPNDHDTPDLSDAALREVLGSWSCELLQSTRTENESGPSLTAQVALADPHLFEVLTGRAKNTLEPWPTLQLTHHTDAANPHLEAVLLLPQAHPDRRGLAILVTVQTPTSTYELTLTPDEHAKEAQKWLGQADASHVEAANETLTVLDVTVVTGDGS